jgi:hypothetical protein
VCRLKIFIVLAILLSSVTSAPKAGHEFTVTEILFIPWGDGSNELQIREPYLEHSEEYPADTAGYLVPGGGPNHTFVDRNENVYFSSYDVHYFKGFDAAGNVIVDYSAGKTQFHDEFFRGMFRGFYVDSLGHIYCNGNEKAGAYVAVADRNDSLLAKLNPLGIDSGLGVSIFSWGSDDVLIFDVEDHGFYTYKNNQFYPGAPLGWRARDGYSYWGFPTSPSELYLLRFSEPDSSGQWTVVDTSFISFKSNNLESGGVLGVDDTMNIYIDFSDTTGAYRGFRVYDQNLNLLDEIQYLPRQENSFLWDTRDPSFRQDGNVYEFHCRDDGMHVFRWSKK